MYFLAADDHIWIYNRSGWENIEHSTYEILYQDHALILTKKENNSPTIQIKRNICAIPIGCNNVIDGIEKILHISSGAQHTVCIDEHNNLWGMGRNEHGQLGSGIESAEKFVRIFLPKIKLCNCAIQSTLVLDINNILYFFGFQSVTAPRGYLKPKIIIKHCLNIKQISSLYNNYYILDFSGDVWILCAKNLELSKINDIKNIIKIIHNIFLDIDGNIWAVKNKAFSKIDLPTIVDVVESNNQMFGSYLLDVNHEIWKCDNVIDNEFIKMIKPFIVKNIFHTINNFEITPIVKSSRNVRISI